MRSFFVLYSAPCCRLLGLLAGALLPGGALAQVGVGTTSPHPQAALDVRGAGKGLLIPRLDSAARAQIGAPPDGLLVFQTDGRAGFWYYQGGLWRYLPDKNRAGDNLGSHTASRPLNLGPFQLVGNGGTQGLSITANGRVGLGVTNPGNGFAQLANTAGNMLGSDGQGGNLTGGAGSLAWAMSTNGYAGLFYNGGTTANANGLAVKVNGTDATATALDVSRGPQTAGGTPLLMVKAGGNVGIGTALPTAALELGGRAAPALLLRSNTSARAQAGMLQFRENDLNYGWNLRHNTGAPENGISDARLVLERLNGAAAQPVMSWNQASGRVGIGNSTPDFTLDVTSTTYIAARLQSDNTAGTWLNLTNTSTGGQGFQIISTGAGNGEGPGKLLFGVGTGGNGSGLIMSMVAANSNVGIGTATPRQKLDVAGNIRCVNLNQTSDARYKRDVRPVTGALALIRQLRGVRYYWKPELADRGYDDREQLGFLAQELNEVLPQAVAQDADGSYSVDYSKVVPVLVEALKEQQAQVEALRQRLEALEKGAR